MGNLRGHPVRPDAGRGWSPWTGPALIVVLACAGAARGEEDPLARLLRAARAMDEPALQAMAEASEHDPWLIVDLLAGEDLGTAAAVYARHAPGPDREALAVYARSLPAEVAGARAALAEARGALERGDVPTALSVLDALAIPATSVYGVARLQVRGEALLQGERAEEAARAFALAAEGAAALGWLRGEDAGLNGRFWSLEAQRRYADGLAALARRRAINEQVQDDLELAFIDRWEGTTWLLRGLPAKARPPLERALAFFARAGLAEEAARAGTQLALAHAMRGAFALALEQAERAEDVARAGHLGEEALYARQSRISILLDMGKHALAAALGEELLAEPDLPWRPAARASVLANLGMGLARLGQRPPAAQRFGEALAVCTEHGLGDLEGETLLLRGLYLHAEGGDPAAALLDCRAALALAPPGGVRAAYAEYGIGCALVANGAHAKAKAHLDAALALAVDLDVIDLQSLVHERLLASALAADDVPGALGHAREAAAAMDLAAHGLSDEEGVAVRTQADRARVFRAWVRAAARVPDDGTALYEAIEAGRARLLLAALGGAASARGRDLTPAVAAEEQRAQAALLEARERFALLRAQNAPMPERREAHEARVRAQARFHEVAARVQREAGARGALAYPQPVSLAELRRRLPGDSALLLFAVHADGAHVLVVTSAGVKRHAVKDWDAVRKACEVVGDPEAETAAFDASARVVRKALLNALELPASVRRVFISPDGPLSGVPWPALEGTSRVPRLLAMIPSAATHHVLVRELVPSGGGALVFGDPLYAKDVGGRPVPWLAGTRYLERLTGTAEEARVITDTPFLRGEATETRFKRELARSPVWDLVHLGCHGVMDRETPSLSALALTPSPEDDGFLTALEVFGLRLQANLVVLSACDVGRGVQAAGEGVLGLVRAFMAAGSPRLLVSLWAVDDRATAALMKHFHALRKQGVRPHEALQRAQRAVRDFKDEDGRRPWSQPYYWAGWVLWGAFE